MNWIRENLTFRQFGQRLDRQGLGQPGHAFQQHMPVGQQPDHQPLDQVGLADDHLAQFVEQRAHERTSFLHRFVNGIDSGIHWFGNTTHAWTVKPENVFKQKREPRSLRSLNAREAGQGCLKLPDRNPGLPPAVLPKGIRQARVYPPGA